MEKRLNELTDKVMEIMKARITEHSHCFKQNRDQCNESDSSLGSPKPELSLSDNFEPSYQSRPHLHDDLSLPSLEKESNLSEVSLSDDFELSYQSRPNLHDVPPLPSLERESDLLMSLSPNLAPHTSHIQISLMMS